MVFGPVLDYFSERYSNIIDVTKNRKIEQDGHDLVFLPGSDFLCGGEYQIGNHKQLSSGRYIQTDKGLVQFKTLEEYVYAIKKGIIRGVFEYSNIGDLRKLVTRPEKTILVCHVPRKFNNLETAVDVAEFGEVYEDFAIQKDIVKKGSAYPWIIAKNLVSENYPVKIKKENRGNADLKDLYEELGIIRAVSGHFHESGHRANDLNSNYVKQGNKVRELFWNSGCLDNGQTGILSVKDEEVSYENINLEKY